MFIHPYLASQVASERRRDMLAQAERERLARQLRALARASRHAARAQRLVTPSVKRRRRAVLPS